MKKEISKILILQHTWIYTFYKKMVYFILMNDVNNF